MIFVYTGTIESRRELNALLAEKKKKDGHITTLSIGRVQGGHFGHKKLFDFAKEIGDYNIFGLGSCQIQEPTRKNPWLTPTRVEIVKALNGLSKKEKGKLAILKLFDIGAVDVADWKEYVLNVITETYKLEKPNVYIAGSNVDIMDNGFHDDDSILAISLDRLNSGIMSGTDIRASIKNGNDEWKHHVPFVLHDLLESTYPEEFTAKYEINKNKENS